MAIDLSDPNNQTFDFTSGSAVSNSIYVPGYCVFQGYVTDTAFAATTDHFEFEVTLDPFSTADADATWIEGIAKDATAIELPASSAAAIAVWFTMANGIPGPARVRFRCSTAAHADVNQDGAKTLTPVFRDLRRG